MNSVRGAFITESLELVRISQLIKAAHSDTSKERILSIRSSEGHTLPQHFLSSAIRT